MDNKKNRAMNSYYKSKLNAMGKPFASFLSVLTFLKIWNKDNKFAIRRQAIFLLIS